jgi:NADPH:quinone reductase-like Zn-dependent oxidoreductase
VTTWRPGDAVVGLSEWLRTRVGTHAEFVVLDADALVPAPAGLPAAEASTLPVNALTAAQALDLAGLAAGQTLAVTGAAGAIGGLAVELARLRGIEVVALASPADRDFLTGRGARFVPRGDRPAAAVRAVAPDGVDGLLDTASLGAPALGAVRDGGVFVGVIPPAIPAAERDIRVTGVAHHYDAAMLGDLLDHAAAGRITARVAATFPLTEAVEAHTLAGKGGVRGRVVLLP